MHGRSEDAVFHVALAEVRRERDSVGSRSYDRHVDRGHLASPILSAGRYWVGAEQATHPMDEAIEDDVLHLDQRGFEMVYVKGVDSAGPNEEIGNEGLDGPRHGDGIAVTLIVERTLEVSNVTREPAHSIYHGA